MKHTDSCMPTNAKLKWTSHTIDPEDTFCTCLLFKRMSPYNRSEILFWPKYSQTSRSIALAFPSSFIVSRHGRLTINKCMTKVNLHFRIPNLFVCFIIKVQPWSCQFIFSDWDPLHQTHMPDGLQFVLIVFIVLSSTPSGQHGGFHWPCGNPSGISYSLAPRGWSFWVKAI